MVSITANTADLEIVKLDDPGRVVKAEDRTLTYTLVYTNHGPMDAQNVTLTDTLPAEVTYLSSVPPAGWTGPTSNAGPPVTLSWFTPTLAVGQSGEIVVTVLVDDGFAGRWSTWPISRPRPTKARTDQPGRGGDRGRYVCGRDDRQDRPAASWSSPATRWCIPWLCTNMGRTRRGTWWSRIR